MRGDTVDVHLPLIGDHMVIYALAALLVASIEGEKLEDAAARLAAMPPIRARFDRILIDRGVTLVCDHQKNSVESLPIAFAAVAPAPGRKVLVISRIRVANEETQALFDAAAQAFVETFDEAIVIGEGVEALTERILERGFAREHLHEARPGILDAIETFRRVVQPGDTVLLKGRIPQKLDRLILALQGQRVVCNLVGCHVTGWNCAQCSMLEKGFGGLEILDLGKRPGVVPVRT